MPTTKRYTTVSPVITQPLLTVLKPWWPLTAPFSKSKSVANVVVVFQYVTVSTTDAGVREDVSTSEVFDVQDSVFLTYTGTSQRDALLAKLLSLFQTTFTSYPLSNVKMVYDHDVAGPAGARQVDIRLQSAIQNARINGVQARIPCPEILQWTSQIQLHYLIPPPSDAMCYCRNTVENGPF